MENYDELFWLDKPGPDFWTNGSSILFGSPHLWKLDYFEYDNFIGNPSVTFFTTDFNKGLAYLSQFLVDRRIKDREDYMFMSLPDTLFIKTLIIRQIAKKNINEEYATLYKHVFNWDNKLAPSLIDPRASSIDFLQKICQVLKTNCNREKSAIDMLYEECTSDSKKLDNLNCFSMCSNGYIDMGMNCLKPQTYIRKVFRNRLECGNKCRVYNFDYFVADCKYGFQEFLLFCIPQCDLDSENRILNCQKSFEKSVRIIF